MATSTKKDIAVHPPPPQEHLVPLLHGFQLLYASKAFADVVITCQGQEFQAHKFCLSAHSDYFRKMLDSEFKEARAGRICADDQDPLIVRALIHWCYNMDYGDDLFRDAGVPLIVLHVKMYAIADKYLIEPLKKLAAAKFQAHAETEWQTSDFADAVTEVYESTIGVGEPIKQIALGVIRVHGGDLLEKGEKYAAFRKMLFDTAELGGDLATTMLCDGKFDVLWKFKCPECGHEFEVGLPRESKVCFDCNSCSYYSSQPKNFDWWKKYEIKE